MVHAGMIAPYRQRLQLAIECDQAGYGGARLPAHIETRASGLLWWFLVAVGGAGIAVAGRGAGPVAGRRCLRQDNKAGREKHGGDESGFHFRITPVMRVIAPYRPRDSGR
jgi:hypothetical protein